MPAPQRFHLLNVSDNGNYGDLLFPLLLTELIRRKCPDAVVRNFAPTRTDWSRLGALPTSSYREFVAESADPKNLTIVVGGGGLLNTSWDQLTWRLPPSLQAIYRNAFLRRIFRRLDVTRRMISPISSHLPFVLSHPMFRKCRVFYNSVGAFPMDHRRLNAADVAHLRAETVQVSVRDNSVVDSLAALGVPSRLTPDSALIMSDIFTPDFIRSRVRPEIVRLASESSYICLQLGNGLGPERLTEFSRNLIAAAKAARHRVILCPIKYSIKNRPGDEVILQCDAFRDQSFVCADPENVFETMYLISHAAGFIGTSLHGFITALSFNVPGFGFPNVDKLVAYATTWVSNDCIIDFESVSTAVERIGEYQPDVIARLVNQQKQMIGNNLDQLFLPDWQKKNISVLPLS